MFYDEIKKNLPSGDLAVNTQITLLNTNVAIIEGYKKLLSFETDQIAYQTLSGIFTISGNNLKIHTINPVELLIKGEITSITVKR